METDKYIEVTDGDLIPAKQTRQAQIEMCNVNVKSFIDALYNMLLALDL